MSDVTRSQEDIVARIRAIVDDDFRGFRKMVLIDALDFAHAREFLLDTVTESEWNSARSASVEDDARKYLAFAVGKIIGHRGLSASRSVDKLGEYAWLLGRDDVVKAMNDADYENYGAPKIKAFATTLGWEWPGDVGEREAIDLERMASGLSCVDDCNLGCGC